MTPPADDADEIWTVVRDCERDVVDGVRLSELEDATLGVYEVGREEIATLGVYEVGREEVGDWALLVEPPESEAGDTETESTVDLVVDDTWAGIDEEPVADPEERVSEGPVDSTDGKVADMLEVRTVETLLEAGREDCCPVETVAD